MRSVIVFLAKAAVTGLLIYWSIRTVSLRAVTERLGEMNLGWIALVIAILMLQIALQSIRWQCVVRACAYPLSVAAAIRLGFIAAFFSQTLPSTIGGDAARVWMLARNHQAGWRAAAYSVFVDRAIGVFALAVLVTVCLPWTFSFVQDPIARIAVAAIGIAGVCGGAVFAALSAAKGTWLTRIWGVRHLVAASDVLRRLATSFRIAALVAVVSIGIHLMTVCVAWSAAQSISAAVSFVQLACLVPPVLLIATAPVTIAGWGLREGLMVTAFTLAGLQPGDALVISLLFGASNFLVGLFGGGVWLTSRFETPAAPDVTARFQDLR